MPFRHERTPIRLTGLPRGAVRGAVLVLEGASVQDVRGASAFCAEFSGRCELVAVDGGLRSCLSARVRPDLFVGDGDSSGGVPADLPSVTYPADKSFSDLAGALREIRKRGAHVVVVAGLLGGRLDHELSNLLELTAHARDFAAILAITDRGSLIVTARGCRAATARRQTVSLFTVGGSAVVTLRGTRWSLHRRLLRPGSLGLSNETGTSLHLTVHRGAAILVFPAIR